MQPEQGDSSDTVGDGEPTREPGARPAFDPTVPPRRAALLPAARGSRRDLTGEVLGGKYRVLRLLGEGGCGTVYEAVDEMLGAAVAVKVLTTDAAGRDDALQQFLGEARLLTSLDHPNVVRWITFDRTPGGLHYFVMELLRGKELSDVLKEHQRLPWKRVVSILLQMLSALRAAHFLPDGRSLLHLDLKPRNVFVIDGEPEQIKVIDFGISQHVGAVARSAAGIELRTSRTLSNEELGETISTRASDNAPAQPGKETVQRARGGTLLYASPEQCLHLIGEHDIVELDGRSDLYSLGIVAFQLLAGRLPWDWRTEHDIIRAHLQLPPPRLAKLGVKVPRALEQFVERCLAKNRDERYRDVREAHAALYRVAHPPGRWPTVVAALAVVVAVVLWIVWPKPKPDALNLVAEDDSIFLGPSQSTVRVAVGNLAPALRDKKVQWVADPQSEADAFPDWKVALDDAGGTTSVVVTAPPASMAVDRAQVYLRVGDQAAAQFSQPLRIVYLTPERWRIDKVSVRGAGERVVDPVGADLEVALQVPDRKWLASVQVAMQGVTLNATLDPSSSTGERLLHTVAMSAFGFAPNEVKAAQFAVTAIDHAGNRHTKELALQVDTRPLSLSAKLRGCIAASTDSYVIYPNTAQILEWQSDRPSRLTIAARDQDQKVVEITRATVPDGEQIAFRAAKLSYAGEIKVTVVDSESTHHVDPVRGQATRVLRFQYEMRGVGVQVAVETPDREQLPTGVAGTSKGSYLTNRDAVSVSVQRAIEVQVSLEVECRRAGQEPVRRPIELHKNQHDRTSFPLAEDGSYELTVRAYRHAGPGIERPKEPEDTQKFTVRRDTKAPRLGVVNLPSPVYREVRAQDAWTGLDVADESEEPVTLQWTLSGPMAQRRGDVVLPASTDGSVPLSCEGMKLDADALDDGAYELSLVAIDAAGNRAPPPEPCQFVIARRGPALTLESPANPLWLPKAGNAFQVQVAATDDNGVRSVSCRLRDAAGAKYEATCRTAGGADPQKADWVGEFALPASWSKRAVTIVCVATDAYGNETQAPPFATTLEEFQLQRSPVIWQELVGSDALFQPMHLVRGDQGYVFGGRAFAEEKKALRAIGVQGELTTENHEVDVPDYYLDENEVTVGQYLAFLGDANGYLDPANWRERKPEARRRGDLQERLGSATSPMLPVTEIDWYEADAYARWAGKRLPSDIEWEYAVRGGRAYRACSWGPGVPPQELNVGGAEGSQAWVVDRGGDVTPAGDGGGIRNLCSNVAEWTSSLTRARDKVFAAGASFEHFAYHFLLMAQRPPTVALPTLGFRCGMTATDVDAAIEQVIRIRIVTAPPPAKGR